MPHVYVSGTSSASAAAVVVVAVVAVVVKAPEDGDKEGGKGEG